MQNFMLSTIPLEKFQKSSPKRIQIQKLKQCISKSPKSALLAAVLLTPFFSCLFCEFSSRSKISTKFCVLFMRILIFFKNMFMGSFQYLLETLEQNAYPMEQNVGIFFIDRSQKNIFYLFQPKDIKLPQKLTKSLHPIVEAQFQTLLGKDGSIMSNIQTYIKEFLHFQKSLK